MRGPRAWSLRRRGAGIGLLGVVLAAGCATPVTTPSRPLAREAAEALFQAWQAEAMGRRGLRCSARLAVDGEGTRLRARQRMAVERPSRLRVEIQGFLGTTAGVLTVNEERYAFLQGEPRVFESGPVDDALLGRVVAVDVSPETVVGVLLGAPEAERASSVTGGRQIGALREVVLEGGRTARFDAEGRLRAYAVAAPGPGGAWRAEFEDYAVVSGVSQAHRITLTVDGGPRVVLVLADIELNPALTPDIFRLDDLAPPAGPGAGVSGG